MATHSDFIKDITISKMQWKLKVRVVRLWEVPDRYNSDTAFSIELVLQDEKIFKICYFLTNLFCSFFHVIGEIVSFSEVKTHKQGGISRKFMDIELEDDEKKKLSATFWGEFIDEIVPHLLSSNNQPIIVVMQLIKAHKFQDSYSVCNTWNASKLWINPNFPQSDEFKTQLLSIRDNYTERLTQTISQQSYSVSDELEKGIVQVKTIVQLVESMQLFYAQPLQCIL
ncbi:uncharacterized protein [Nicotiana sylvestris]|uniref:uncharacterized protein n=1 Tax=Nicotiana sylvestris TaxID=4096 RepID=UPI00388CC2BB